MKNVQIGIWLDYKEAYIIMLENSEVTKVEHLLSNVTHPAVKGGTRSKTPWGPQYSPADERALEKETRAEQQYFEEILSMIPDDTDSIVIFGPAEAKTGLKKKIESIKHYKPQLLGVFPSDYMTDNQRLALMRDYFGTAAQV